MGNYNGDMSDDLLPRSESIPISPTSCVQEIHNLFGVTCELTKHVPVSITNQPNKMLIYIHFHRDNKQARRQPFHI